MPDALRTRDFFDLASAYHDGAMMEDTGISELSQVLRISETQRRDFVWITKDRLVYRKASRLLGKRTEVKITALSPSDRAITLLRADFAAQRLVPLLPKRRLPTPSTNMTSVVLHCSVGPLSLLLGSDLEVHPDPQLGWQDVRSCQTAVPRSEVFKIPHHGSHPATMIRFGPTTW